MWVFTKFTCIAPLFYSVLQYLCALKNKFEKPLGSNRLHTESMRSPHAENGGSEWDE